MASPEKEEGTVGVELLTMEPVDLSLYLKGEGVPEDVCGQFEGMSHMHRGPSQGCLVRLLHGTHR